MELFSYIWDETGGMFIGEEGHGPITCTVVLDMATGQTYLDVAEQTADADPTLTRAYDACLYTVKVSDPDENYIANCTIWTCHPCDRCRMIAPVAVKSYHAKQNKYRTIDA